MTNLAPFTPDWVSPPGDSLADALDEQGLTQAKLAERTGLSRKHINDLVRGRASISASTAMKLEAVVGGNARFWLTREAQYQEVMARRERLEALRADAGWLSDLPVADIVRFKWIRRFSHRGEQVEECLRFFGVAGVDEWMAVWRDPLAAFRASDKAKKQFGAVASWLRQGEREASAIACRPYDRSAFIDMIGELRSMSREPNPSVFIPELQRSCRQAGVAVVFVPTPKGCPASGATRWLMPDKAMLMLSLRHKTNDHLWFSFFHECGHLVKHGKRMLFLEGTDTISAEQEREADRFARDLLIPPSYMSRLHSLGYSKEKVQALAGHVGVAPGIVVGRLQHEELLPWSHLNDLKVRYEWTPAG
jgi:HTH-type transcriptional regulator / antitoxin HigA